MTTDRQPPRRTLRVVSATVACPKGHDIVTPMSAVERVRYEKAPPAMRTYMVRCSCGRMVWMTAGAIQRAA